MSNPIIDSVIVDSAVTQITVSGNDFQPGAVAPLVRFNNSTLTVTSFSNTSFVATLPAGLVSGTYLLEVENSDTFTNTEKFEVAISGSGVFSSYGFLDPNSGNYFGHAENVTVSSTPLSIPLVGSGLSSPGKYFAPPFGSISSLTRLSVLLQVALPTSAGVLSAKLRNLTTSTNGPLNELSSVPGTTYFGTPVSPAAGTFTFSMSVNDGDQLALVLSVSGSPVTLDTIQWSGN